MGPGRSNAIRQPEHDCWFYRRIARPARIGSADRPVLLRMGQWNIFPGGHDRGHSMGYRFQAMGTRFLGESNNQQRDSLHDGGGILSR